MPTPFTSGIFPGMTISHNPLTAASHVQEMATKAGSDRLAMVFTGLSIGLVALMAIREARDLFRDKDRHGHFTENYDRNEGARRLR